jgi:uncharacterized membrane protein
MSSGSFTPSIKLEHVISFSDAIFAFAITLITLSIDIPDLPTDLTQSELLDKLYELYPQFESYIISFAVIAIFWVSYHQVFNHIKGSHITMVYLNLLLLLLITSIITFYLTSNKLWNISNSLCYLLFYCNYDKFVTCNDMVVCYKE